MKLTTLDAALAVLAAPEGAKDADLYDAARILNEAIRGQASEVAAVEGRYARESLDLLNRGDDAAAMALAREINASRQRLAQLRQAGREANRRMEQALRVTEAATEGEHWEAVAVLMKEREEATGKMVELIREFGPVFTKIAALADQIWDTLPSKPHSNPAHIDFYDKQGMELGLAHLLYHVTSGQLGEDSLGAVPDLLRACRTGHAALLSKKPVDGLRQAPEIDEDEWERRVGKAA